jgi:hypothetical protein
MKRKRTLKKLLSGADASVMQRGKSFLIDSFH